MAHLRLEARALLVRVVELCEAVGDLHAETERLEPLGEPLDSSRWPLANGDSSTG